tara:strand:+ start:41 stop:277 length:237 start_codon:yes stop_codon:yes gene_type:complete
MAIQGIIVPATTPITGSINKIYAPGACNVTSLFFGNDTKPHSSVSSSTTTIAIPAGGYLEGPIVQYKASIITIAYINK